MDTHMSKHLVMNIAGTDLPLMEVAVIDKETKAPRADGRTWFAFCDYDSTKGQFRKPTKFGVQWEALAKKLPTSITVDGVKVVLTHGQTAAEYNGKPQVQRDKASFSGNVLLPTIGEERNLKVTISVTSDGLWNIKASVTRTGSSASPEDKQEAAKAKAKAANDIFAAIFASA
jgi:hypothetical protein